MPTSNEPILVYAERGHPNNPIRNTYWFGRADASGWRKYMRHNGFYTDRRADSRVKLENATVGGKLVVRWEFNNQTEQLENNVVKIEDAS